MTEPAFDPRGVAVRRAATVMLVRDGATGLEVFMLRRTPTAAFAASMYVFPGGRVDDADAGASMQPWCDGRTDAAASGVLAVPSGGLSYWVAAIRECFEEAGVLLARDGVTGDLVAFDDPAVAVRFSAYRRAVHAGRLDLGELCRRERLRLATDAIGYVSHWITPIGPARRFDARFFVARAPQAQHPLHDEHETVESLWVSPGDALARFERGEFSMFAPTVANLGFLDVHRGADEAVAAAAAAGAGAPTMLPKVRVDREGLVVGRLVPGDACYDAAADYTVVE